MKKKLAKLDPDNPYRFMVRSGGMMPRAWIVNGPGIVNVTYDSEGDAIATCDLLWRAFVAGTTHAADAGEGEG